MEQLQFFATISQVSGIIVIAGCASAGYQGMTADQIAATAKMKDANVNCVVVASPWGKGTTTFVNIDKGVIQTGTVTVDADCKITVNNAPAATPALK
jgi:hypothetical protein